MNTDASTGGHSPAGQPMSRSSRCSRLAATFIAYWLPVLLWCAVIFGFSSDAGSSQRTSRFIRPILRWLIPGISDEAVGHVQLVVRKSAHMTEYAVLALLLWRARRQPSRGDQRPWRWSEAGFAFGIAVGYAVTDEFHQIFVPTREGKPLDVLIDASGALLGLLALRAWGKWRGRW